MVLLVLKNDIQMLGGRALWAFWQWGTNNGWTDCEVWLPSLFTLFRLFGVPFLTVPLMTHSYKPYERFFLLDASWKLWNLNFLHVARSFCRFSSRDPPIPSLMDNVIRHLSRSKLAVKLICFNMSLRIWPKKAMSTNSWSVAPLSWTYFAWYRNTFEVWPLLTFSCDRRRRKIIEFGRQPSC